MLTELKKLWGDMTDMRLDGFGIMVDDMPTMVRFYRDVLGFGIKEDENTSNVYLEKDGTLFLLYRKSDFVDNDEAVDSAFNDVVQKGAREVMKPTTEPWGQRTCYIADPEGNLIEIGSFTNEGEIQA
jgi:catechol 2,3-dioxygenase-like lactoylglutathione lyase family enzyme